ncbi:hypothetical protein Esti_001882 [Eimeria stiedai]
MEPDHQRFREALAFLHRNEVGGPRSSRSRSRSSSGSSSSSDSSSSENSSNSSTRRKGNSKPPGFVLGPFGPRPLLYFDFAATGRPLRCVEKWLYSSVLPLAGNTHTHQAALGRQATFFLREARQIAKEYFNAGPDDALYFCGSGASAAATKFLQLLLLGAPLVAAAAQGTSPAAAAAASHQSAASTAAAAAAAISLLSGPHAASAAAAAAAVAASPQTVRNSSSNGSSSNGSSSNGSSSNGSSSKSYLQAFSEVFEEDRWHSFRCRRCSSILKTSLHARRHLYQHAAADLDAAATVQQQQQQQQQEQQQQRPHVHIMFLCDPSGHHSLLLPFSAVQTHPPNSSSSSYCSSMKSRAGSAAAAAAAAHAGAYCWPSDASPCSKAATTMAAAPATAATAGAPAAAPAAAAAAAAGVSFSFQLLSLDTTTGGLFFRNLRHVLHSVSSYCSRYNQQQQLQQQQEIEIEEEDCCTCCIGSSSSKGPTCCYKGFASFFSGLGLERQPVCLIPVGLISAASNVTGALLSKRCFFSSSSSNSSSSSSSRSHGGEAAFAASMGSLCKLVHAYGGLVAVDAAAAAAHVPIDFNPLHQLVQEQQQQQQQQHQPIYEQQQQEQQEEEDTFSPRLLFSHPWLCPCTAAAAGAVAAAAATPTAVASGAAAPDALFFSAHKLLGGTGSAGLLLVKKRLLLSDLPCHPAGGSVYLVNAKWEQQQQQQQEQEQEAGEEASASLHAVYLMERAEDREEGGSPNLPAVCRAALALRLLQQLPLAQLRLREDLAVQALLRIWGSHPRIQLVGNVSAPRVGIVSFLIKYGNSLRRPTAAAAAGAPATGAAAAAGGGGGAETEAAAGARGGLYLHPNFVVRLLSDLFGVQSRSGCLCAGPYTAFCLGLSSSVVAAAEALLLLTGQELLRPGVVRVSVSLALQQLQLQQLLLAVLWVATHGYKLLPAYSVEAETGDWIPTAAAAAAAAGAEGAPLAAAAPGGAADEKRRVWLSDFSLKIYSSSSSRRSRRSQQLEVAAAAAAAAAAASNPVAEMLQFANQVTSRCIRRFSSAAPHRALLLRLPATSPVSLRLPLLEASEQPRLGPSETAAAAAAAADYHASVLQTCASMVWFALPEDGRASLALWKQPQQQQQQRQLQQAEYLETFGEVMQGLQQQQQGGQLVELLHRDGEDSIRPVVAEAAVQWVPAAAAASNAASVAGSAAAGPYAAAAAREAAGGALRALDSPFEVRRYPTEQTLQCTCCSSSNSSSSSSGSSNSSSRSACSACKALNKALEMCMSANDLWDFSNAKAGSSDSSSSSYSFSEREKRHKKQHQREQRRQKQQQQKQQEKAKQQRPGKTLAQQATAAAGKEAASACLTTRAAAAAAGEVASASGPAATTAAVATANETAAPVEDALFSREEATGSAASPTPSEAAAAEATAPAAAAPAARAAAAAAASGGKVKRLAIPRELRRSVGLALHAFKMLQDGDSVLVGLSGGKDSLTLLHVLLDVQQRAPIQFRVAAATVDPLHSSYNPGPLGPYLQSIGVAWHRLQLPIVELAKQHMHRQSICAFCSRMRRGLLYSCMRKHGFNVLALGQHLDDLVESFVMSAFNNGAINTMKAHYLVETGDLRVVRPLVLTRERATEAFAEAHRLPVISENCPACFAHPKERHRVKLLLSEQEKEIPNLFSNLQKALLPLMAVNTAARGGFVSGCQKQQQQQQQQQQQHLESEEPLHRELAALLEGHLSAPAAAAAAAEDEAAALSLTACGSEGCMRQPASLRA